MARRSASDFVTRQRRFRATAKSLFVIPLPAVLPEKFTVEIEVINRKGLDGPAFQMQGNLVPTRDGKTSTISWGSGGAALTGGGGGEAPYSYDEATRARYRGKPAELRVLGDGEYLKGLSRRKTVRQYPKRQVYPVDRLEHRPRCPGRR